MSKVGRNAPCPCGSGKKYKNCCLKSEMKPPRSKPLMVLEVSSRNEEASLDIHELMLLAEGSEREFSPEEKKRVQTVISVDLPFHIRGLGKVLAPVQLKGKSYGVVLEKRTRPDGIRRYFWGLAELDFDIQCDRDIDMEDRWGRAFYTNATITIPWYIDLLGLRGDQEQFIKEEEKALQLICRVLNFLIKNYSYYAKYYHLRSLCTADIEKYSFCHLYEDKRYNLVHRMFRSGARLGKIPTLKDPRLWVDIGVAEELMVYAKRSFEYEDYRLCILDAVISLEITVSNHIRNKGNQAGISKSEINRFIQGVGLTGNVKIALRFLNPDMDFDEEVLSGCKAAITIRNKIVHEGRTHVSEKEARDALDNIDALCRVIKQLDQTESSGA